MAAGQWKRRCTGAVGKWGSAAAGRQRQQELVLELELDREQEQQHVVQSLAANGPDSENGALNIGEQVWVCSPTSLSSGANTFIILVPLATDPTKKN